MTAAVDLRRRQRTLRHARDCVRCGADTRTNAPVPVCRECVAAAREAARARPPEPARYVPAVGDVRAANCGGCRRTGACEWTPRGWRCGRCVAFAERAEAGR